MYFLNLVLDIDCMIREWCALC